MTSRFHSLLKSIAGGRTLYYAVVFGLTCTLSASAEVAAVGIVYVYPPPDAIAVSPQTTLIVRLGQEINRATYRHDCIIRVEGSSSGRHTGELILAGDNCTVVFRPQHSFSAGERVTVWFMHGSGHGETPCSISFMFQTKDKSSDQSPSSPALDLTGQALSSELWRARTGRTWDSPLVEVITNNHPAPGWIFLSPFLRNSPRLTYLTILDEQFTPVFQSTRQESMIDFKLLSNGLTTFFDNGN